MEDWKNIQKRYKTREIVGITCMVIFMNEHSLEYMKIYDEKVKGKIGRNDFCVCGSGKKYKKCCLRKYELVAQILMGVQNQKGINYTIPGVEWTEDSILEYQGPRDKISNQHDKEILDEIMKLVFFGVSQNAFSRCWIIIK